MEKRITPKGNAAPSRDGTQPTPVVYFANGGWRSTDGSPVCDDHATLEPCPHHRQRHR